MTFGTINDEDESFEFLDVVLDMGGNFIDTAHIYSDWHCEKFNVPRGVSELTIGKWIKATGRRHELIIATKGAHPPMDVMPQIYRPRLAPEDISQDLGESLERMGIETIDLYYLHRDDMAIPVNEIVDALQAEVDKDRIRYYGASNWMPARVKAANEYAYGKGWSGFVATQNMWSLALLNPGNPPGPGLQAMGSQMIDYQRENNTAAIPYASQANGFFSGKYYRGMKLDNPKAKNVAGLYFNEESFARLDRVHAMSEEKGLSMNQIAVAYLTNQDFPVFPIVGSRTMTQLKDSCGAGDVVLSTEEVRRLDLRDGSG